MGWLQILKHLRYCDGRALETQMNADGKAIGRWDVLQQIGDPK